MAKKERKGGGGGADERRQADVVLKSDDCADFHVRIETSSCVCDDGDGYTKEFHDAHWVLLERGRSEKVEVREKIRRRTATCSRVKPS
jgi:hypothetical protein